MNDPILANALSTGSYTPPQVSAGFALTHICFVLTSLDVPFLFTSVQLDHSFQADHNHKCRV